MKTKSLFLLPLMFIFLAVSVQAASMAVSVIYDATPDYGLTVMNGDSVGFTVVANSLFEPSMDIKVELLDSNDNHVVSTFISVYTTQDSYFDHVVFDKSAYNSNPGTYIIKATATNQAGASVRQDLLLWVLPITPTNHVPVITSTAPTSVDEGQNYVYDVEASDADGDSLTYSLITANSPTGMTINPTTGVISWTAPQLNSDLQFVATVQVSDGKDFASQTFTIDVKNVVVVPNNYPVITSMPIMSVNEGNSYTYQVLANDPDGDALTYSLSSSPSWLSINSQTGLLSGNAPQVDADTVFFVAILVSDSKGASTTQSYSLTVIDLTIGNHLPVITSTPITQVNEGQAYSYDVNANDVDGNILTYSFTTAPGWLSINPTTGVITGVAPQVVSDESYLVIVGVSDGIGATPQVYTLTVKDVIVLPTNHAPTASNQNVQTGKNVSLSVVLSGSDIDGDTLTFSIVSNPSHGLVSGFNPTTGTLTYTPNTNFVGSDSFTFRVNDGQLNSNVATVSINVVDVPVGNTLPVVTSTPVTQVNEGSNYVYDVNATDADGNTLSYSLTNAPLWLSINPITGLISGTAPQVSSNTNYPIVVRISDGAGFVTQSYTLTVRNVVNPNPNPSSSGKSHGGVGVSSLPSDEFYETKYANQNNPIVLGEDTQPASPTTKPASSLAKALVWLFILILILIILIILFLLRRA